MGERLLRKPKIQNNFWVYDANAARTPATNNITDFRLQHHQFAHCRGPEPH
jgi:hypothetical protein